MPSMSRIALRCLQRFLRCYRLGTLNNTTHAIDLSFGKASDAFDAAHDAFKMCGGVEKSAT